MKKQKRPNGAGKSVRRPNGKYSAIITIGYDEYGKQRTKSLGTFHTKADSDAALNEYYKKTKGIDKATKDYTFDDVFDLSMRYQDKTAKRINSKKSSSDQYKYAKKVFEGIYSLPFSSIHFEKLIEIIHNAKKGAPTNKVIKNMLTIMYKYAHRNRIVADNPTTNDENWQTIPLAQESEAHKVFSAIEIQKLFNYTDKDKNANIKDLIKVLLYTGLRINELFTLKKEDIIWNDEYRAIKLREENAKDHKSREIPLHSNIQRIIHHLMKNKESDYLFVNKSNKPYHYRNFRDAYWNPVMEMNGMKHLPHDTRYTFKTFASKCNMEACVVEKFMGHSIGKSMEHHYNDLMKSNPNDESKFFLYDQMQLLKFESNSLQRPKLENFDEE